jgi:hypothetical protein
MYLLLLGMLFASVRMADTLVLHFEFPTEINASEL